jgi:hypothetical protein
MEMTSDMMGDAIDDAMEVRYRVQLSQLSNLQRVCSAVCVWDIPSEVYDDAIAVPRLQTLDVTVQQNASRMCCCMYTSMSAITWHGDDQRHDGRRD